MFHYLSSFKINVDVVRNDKITSKQILNKKYNKIVISPGPGNPNQSGNCLNIVKSLHKKVPILGVCLGLQIIGKPFDEQGILNIAYSMEEKINFKLNINDWWIK